MPIARMASMKENFNFSIDVHEELSRVRLGTQTVALIYRSVEAHIFIRDPKHTPPMITADHINEYRSTAAVAGLTTFVDKGNKLWWVNEQHRIHPSMLPFSDKESYGGILTNAPPYPKWRRNSPALMPRSSLGPKIYGTC